MRSERDIITVHSGAGEGRLLDGTIRYTAVSSVGGRDSQQDSLFVGEKDSTLFAVVCDGMGGMQGGERASTLAVQMIVEAYYAQDLASVPNFYKEAVRHIDEAVCALSDRDVRLGAGSTIIAAVLDTRDLYWLSVGDSKLYLYRGGTLICPVKAHNYKLLLEEMLSAGKINEDLFRRELPRGEALISYLGMGGIERMEINRNPFRTQAGDQILLCSDGLYKSLLDVRIRDILDLNIPLDTKGKLLLGEALEAGGSRQDNTSVILIGT